jgi:glycosyltransferase involved in cell wall biosynthesis
MKIRFSNVNFSSRSGPNTFAYRLAHQFSLDGHEIADVTDYDVALAMIEPNEKLLPNKPLVQRLDGIWFSPAEYETRNTTIKACYDHADAIVFQSSFNAQQITTWWGTPKLYSVIPNGINLERMTTSEPGFWQLRKEYTTIFVASANWHRQKRLSENIRFYKHMRAYMPNSCLVVLGANPDCEVADPHIFYTGSMPHETCLKLYAVADWMIHLSWLDHCPNVVVEALSQGTPVICASDGGTKELVKNNGIVIDETEKYDFTLRDYDNPPMLPADFGGLTSLPKISVEPDYLDIKIAAKNYVKLFEEVINAHK